MRKSVVAKAPLRISLLGGGSDFPEYLARRPWGGACLSLAIGNYYTVSLDEDDDIFRHQRDKSLPHGTGLGSSSAAAVATVCAYAARKAGELPSKKAVARLAWETEVAGGSMCGRQDHYASAHGWLNAFTFKDDPDDDQVDFLRPDRAEWLARSCLLVDVGEPRDGNSILKDQRASIDANMSTIDAMASLVSAGRSAVVDMDLPRLANLVNVSWGMKSTLAEGISNSKVDDTIDAVKVCGALGAKLLGAGGSGYVLAMCEDADYVDTALSRGGFTVRRVTPGKPTILLGTREMSLRP